MLTLVVGGAGSGKSEYAESLLLKTALPRYYIATMQVLDTESRARVQRHQAMRAQKNFATIECQFDLKALRLPARGVALLEDIGNLTANELYGSHGAGDNTAQAILSGVAALEAQCEKLVIVSNEVGSGGDAYEGDTAHYLRVLAQVNNSLAARADNVCRLACGVPVYYKGEETQE